MPFSVSPGELIVVLIIALIVLGPKRLPEVGRSIGNGMREFRDSLSGESRRRDDDDEDDFAPLNRTTAE
jgi:sec-independent protein translocase protein TatA